MATGIVYNLQAKPNAIAIATSKIKKVRKGLEGKGLKREICSLPPTPWLETASSYRAAARRRAVDRFQFQRGNRRGVVLQPRAVIRRDPVDFSAEASVQEPRWRGS